MKILMHLKTHKLWKNYYRQSMTSRINLINLFPMKRRIIQRSLTTKLMRPKEFCKIADAMVHITIDKYMPNHALPTIMISEVLQQENKVRPTNWDQQSSKIYNKTNTIIVYLIILVVFTFL